MQASLSVVLMEIPTWFRNAVLPQLKHSSLLLNTIGIMTGCDHASDPVCIALAACSLSPALTNYKCKTTCA